jgi:hypothetical protein
MATLQPGQATTAGQIGAAGGTATVAGATGMLTHPDNKFGIKTNDKTVTGTGTEGPSAIPGGTIADGRVRGTVDTRNAGYIGAVGGPDTEAPREWT